MFQSLQLAELTMVFVILAPVALLAFIGYKLATKR